MRAKGGVHGGEIRKTLRIQAGQASPSKLRFRAASRGSLFLCGRPLWRYSGTRVASVSQRQYSGSGIRCKIVLRGFSTVRPLWRDHRSVAAFSGAPIFCGMRGCGSSRLFSHDPGRPIERIPRRTSGYRRETGIPPAGNRESLASYGHRMVFTRRISRHGGPHFGRQSGSPVSFQTNGVHRIRFRGRILPSRPKGCPSSACNRELLGIRWILRCSGFVP